MKRIMTIAAGLSAAAFLFPCSLFADGSGYGGNIVPVSIYGEDDRVDYYEADRFPLAINRGAAAAAGTKLFTIGYPSGMPLKVAGNASVRSVNAAKGFFVTDLDTFAGNSGSPVFNAGTMMIEGVLTRGGTDYIHTESDGSYYDPRRPHGYAPGSAHKVGQDEGRGEDVTFIGRLKGSLPVTEFERAILDAEKRNIPTQAPSLRDSGIVPAVYRPAEQGGAGFVPAVYYPDERDIPEPTIMEI